MEHGPCSITSQHFEFSYGCYRTMIRGTWSGGHENDPSTQIHYFKSCPTWSKSGKIELEFGQDLR